MKKGTVNHAVVKRRELRARVLPLVRKLVDEYDFSAVNSALKAISDERKAIKEVKAAEQALAALKAKLK